VATTRLACSFRLHAEVLLLAIVLTACAPSRPLDDQTISTQVKIELLGDRELGLRRIDVTTLQGVVTLTGTVGAQADADRAVTLARHVRGVKDVKLQLKVGSSH